MLKLSSTESSGLNVRGSSDAPSQDPDLAPSTLLPQLLCLAENLKLSRSPFKKFPPQAVHLPVCDFEGIALDFLSRLAPSFPQASPGPQQNSRAFNQNLVWASAALPGNTPVPFLPPQSQPFLFLSE